MATITAYDQRQFNSLNLPSLQEMMAAPAYMQQQHDLALEESGKLTAEANLAANLAMEDPNSKAASAYQAYVGDLNKATELLTSKGLKGSNIKAALSSAKGRYTGEIMPIIKAGEVREKDKVILNQLSLADPSIIMDVDPTQYTIDAYIGRGNTSYVPTAVSGKALEDATANAVKHLQDQIQADPKRIFSNTNLPFEYMARINRGATPAEVEVAMRQEGFDGKDVNTMTSMLRNAVESSLKSHGVYEKFANRPDLVEKAWTNASRGLYAAIGKPDVQFKTDSYGMQLSLMKEKEAVDRREAAEKAGLGKSDYRQVSLLEIGKDATEATKGILSKIEDAYKKYLDPNTKLSISKEEQARLNTKEPFVGMNQQIGKTLSRKQDKKTSTLWTKLDYVNEIKKIGKEIGYDVYGAPDNKGVRTLKPFSQIKREMETHISNLSALESADALDINTPEASNAFWSKFSEKDTDIVNDKGEKMKLSKFANSTPDKDGNMSTESLTGTEILVSPKTKKIIFISPDGEKGYLNLDKFPTIKAAFEKYQEKYLNNFLGYTNSITGQRHGYVENVENINDRLESEGKSSYKINLKKYDVNSTVGQLQLAQEIADRQIMIQRDELIPQFENQYQELPEETRRNISQREFIQANLDSAKRFLLQIMQSNAGIEPSTDITDIVVNNLLKSTELKKNPVEF